MKTKETRIDEFKNILLLLQKNQQEIERLNQEGKSPSKVPAQIRHLTSNHLGKSRFTHTEFTL